MIPRRASVTLPPESKHFNGLAMMRHALTRMSPQRTGLFHLSLWER